MFLTAILVAITPPAAPLEWYRVASSKQAVVYVARLSTLGERLSYRVGGDLSYRADSRQRSRHARET